MNGYTKNHISTIFIPLLVAYGVVIFVLPSVGMDLAKFLVFQFLFLLIPGHYLACKLLKTETDAITKAILGYFPCLALLYILSWTGKLCGTALLPLCMLGITVVSAVSIMRQRNTTSYHNVEANTNGIPWLNTISFSVAVAIVLTTFVIPSLPPDAAHKGLFYWDDLFEVGNAWAYTRGVPMEDPRFLGHAFPPYHLSKSIYEGMIYDVFKVNPFITHFYLSPIFDLFIFTYVLTFIGCSIARLTLKQSIFLVVFLLFSGGIVCTISIANAIYFNQLVNLTGYSALLVFFFLLIYYFQKNKELPVIYLTLCALIFFATNVFLILVVTLALFLIFILNVTQKKYSPKELFLGVGLCIAIILLKLTIYKSIAQGEAQIGLHFYNVATDFILYPHFVKIITPFGLSYNLPWALFMFIFTVIESITTTGFIVFLFSFSKNNMADILKKRSFILMLFCFLIPVLLNCFVYIYGGNYRPSQIAYVSSAVLGTLAVPYAIEIRSRRIIIVILFVFAGLFSIRIIRYVSLSEFLQCKTWRKTDLHFSAISLDEWNALQWMNKNTNPLAVFITDRTWASGKNTLVSHFHVYTAISGRQACFESTSFGMPKNDVVKKNYAETLHFLEQISRPETAANPISINADYFISCNKKLSDTLNPNMRVVYANASMRIFEIRHPSSPFQRIAP